MFIGYGIIICLSLGLRWWQGMCMLILGVMRAIKMGQGDFVSMNYRRVVGLEKQIGKEWKSLEKIESVIDNDWHTLEIRSYGDVINVYVDNELVAKHRDTTNTFLSG